MRVVVDTNVWISGLIVPSSTPRAVVMAARRQEITVVASWELAQELADVLRRPKFRRYRIAQEDIEEVLLLLTPALPTVEIDVVPRDPDDAHVVAAALAGRADAIVTGDRDLLADEDLREWLRARGVVLHTPASLLDELS